MPINWKLITGGNEDETIDVSTTRSINRLANEATVTLDDPDGTIADNYDFGDQVLLQRTDGLEWVGIKTGDRERLDRLELQANSYDYYLQRQVTVRYENEFISDILKDLIDRTPIKWNATNVSVQNDREITWELRGEPIKEGLDDLSRLSVGEHYGVQNLPTTNEFFFKPRGSERAPYDFTENNYQTAEFGEDDRKEINRVVVYYGEGEGRDKVIVEDSQAISDLSSSTVYDGDAVLELSKYYPQIIDPAIAEEKANALLDRFSIVQFGTIYTPDAYELKPGQETRVVNSRKNIDEDFRIVKVDHEWLDTDQVRVAEAVDGILSELSRNKDETKRIEHQSIADPGEIEAETLSPSRGASGNKNPTSLQTQSLSDDDTASLREFVPEGRRIDVEVAGVIPDDPEGTDPDLSAEVLSLNAFGSALSPISTVTPTSDEVSIQTQSIDDGEVILYDATNVELDRVPANSSGWEDTSAVGGTAIEAVRAVGEPESTTVETISVNNDTGGSGGTTTVDVDVNQESVIHETRQKWVRNSPLARVDGPVDVRFAIRNQTGSSMTAGGRWVYAPILGQTTLDPANADLFVAEDGDGDLHAIDSSGSEVWTTNVSMSTSAPVPPLADDTVFFGSTSNDSYALNSDDGAVQWNYTRGFTDYSAACVIEDLYIVGGDNELTALNFDGNVAWTLSESGVDFWYGTSYADGSIYAIAAGGAALVSVSTSGTKNWSYAVGASNGTAPIPHNGNIYFYHSDDQLTSVDSTGSENWTVGLPSATDYVSPTVIDGTVFIGHADGVTAYDTADGSTAWSQSYTSFNAGFNSGVVIDGLYHQGLYDSSAGTGQVVGLDVDTGAESFSVSLPNEAYAALAHRAGKLHIGDIGGVWHQIDIESASVDWTYSINDSFFIDGTFGSSVGVALSNRPGVYKQNTEPLEPS